MRFVPIHILGLKKYIKHRMIILLALFMQSHTLFISTAVMDNAVQYLET